MRKAQFTSPLTVAFTQEVYDRIKHLTDENQLSMAELVRNIVDNELPKLSMDPENSQRDEIGVEM